MQGRSFLPLVRGRRIAGWPESVYYHYYEFPAVHMAKRHYGVRTARYKLIHFYDDIDAWELYDLEKDPRELKNVFDDPAYAAARRGLETELARLEGLLSRLGARDARRRREESDNLTWRSAFSGNSSSSWPPPS